MGRAGSPGQPSLRMRRGGIYLADNGGVAWRSYPQGLSHKAADVDEDAGSGAAPCLQRHVRSVNGASGGGGVEGRAG